MLQSCGRPTGPVGNYGRRAASWHLKDREKERMKYFFVFLDDPGMCVQTHRICMKPASRTERDDNMDGRGTQFNTLGF